MTSVRRAAVSILLVALVACSGGSSDAPSGGASEAQPSTTVILDLTSTTSMAGSVDGLSGIALVDHGRTLVVQRNTVQGDLELLAVPYRTSGRLDPKAARTVMRFPHPYVHNGGGLALLPSGDLLVTVVVDTGFLGDPAGSLQRPDGLVIRVPGRYLSGDGAGRFQPTAADVVARGLRNPFRISVDPQTGDLWLPDIGENTVEELNHIPAADLHGPPRNFGWPYDEGTTSNIERPAGAPDGIAPIFQYRHSDRRCSILGGLVYRGAALPGLRGSYVFGDYCGETLLALLPARGSEAVGDKVGKLVAIGENGASPTRLVADSTGEIHALGNDGRITELVAAGTDSADPTAVHAEVQASIWGADEAPIPGYEATDLAFAGSDRTMIVSVRSGLIVRVDLDRRTTDPAAMSAADELRRVDPEPLDGPVCTTGHAAADLTVTGFGELPASKLRPTLQKAAKAWTDLAPLLPPSLDAERTVLDATYRDLVAAAEAADWDPTDPALRDLFHAVDAERGTHAAAYYSMQMVGDLLARCGS